ncbi:MAG: thioredoxin family protein [Desulfobacteraceae bacterium]|nr:MAG: thioredoxin family protein [Desulfobacteraceae bacterium]
MTVKAMKYQLFFLMLISSVVAFCLAVPVSSQASTIDWKGYDTGMTDAQDEGKKVLIHFRTDWCTYCRKMDATTFKDEDVVTYLNDNFVPILVDGDKEKKVATKFGIKGYPTNWFLTEEVERISSLPGYVDAKRFLLILKYIHTDNYKEMSFTDFVQSQ